MASCARPSTSRADDLDSGSNSEEEEYVGGESSQEESDNESEYSEHDSASELEDDGTTEEEDGDDEVTDEDYFLGKDKVTQWNKKPPPASRTRAHNIITVLPGCKGPAIDVRTPMDALLLFLTDDLISLLVDNTNLFIGRVAVKFFRERDARLTDIHEMKSFLGLLILSGVL